MATSEEKWKNIFFLYKSIGLVPKIVITHISATICPICIILGPLDSSQLVLSKSGNGHIYYKSTISTFKVLQRSTQGQRTTLYKKRLTVLVSLIHALWGLLVTFSDLFYVGRLFLAMCETYFENKSKWEKKCPLVSKEDIVFLRTLISFSLCI